MEKQAALHFIVIRDEDGQERRYEFIAPAGAPFGETHDALYEILKEILRMAQEAATKIVPKEEYEK